MVDSFCTERPMSVQERSPGSPTTPVARQACFRGLLAAIAPDAWPALRQRFEAAGVACWQIGEVTADAGIEVV